MRIDVWADVVCPWCWLGKARLDKATAGLDGGVEVVFRSFELQPSMPKDTDVPMNEILTKKLGMSPAQLEASHARLQALGAADGIEYRFERTRTSNTFAAHQLVHFARERGAQLPMVERLFRANFHDGVRIGDPAELARLATEVGLDRAEVERALAEERYAPAVRDDEQKARAIGVTGVPFYLVDGRLGVAGAQPVEALRGAIAEVRRGASG